MPERHPSELLASVKIPDSLLYSQSTHGHRLSYITAFSCISECDILVHPNPWRVIFRLLAARNVLFVTADDCFLSALIISFLRLLYFSRPCQLLLLDSFQNDFGLSRSRGLMFLKYILVFLLDKINIVRIFTVLPVDLLFSSNHFYPKLSHLWDPAFWDLAAGSHAVEVTITELGDDIPLFKSSVNTILYLGSLCHRKLFSIYADIAYTIKTDPHFSAVSPYFNFIAAGQAKEDIILPPSGSTWLHVVPRYLSEAEVVHLQRSASVFWACYDQSFDQSSGIVGRGYQLRKSLIVREGSLVSRVCRHLQTPTIEIQPFQPKSSCLLSDVISIQSYSTHIVRALQCNA